MREGTRMDKIGPSISEEDKNVLITIPKSRMSDFLGDVLKSKRTISKVFPVQYNLKKEHVIDMINVINHRIKEQNNAEMIDVDIDVFFDDGSSRNYVTVSQFQTIDDNLSAISVAILVKISYLMRFHDDDNISKQEILIGANSNNAGSLRNPLKLTLDSSIRIMVRTNSFTWAEDVINHFSNYIKGRFSARGFVVNLIHLLYLNRLYSNFTFLFIFLGSIVVATYSFGRGIDMPTASSQAIEKYIGGESLIAVNKKIDYLIEVSALKDENLKNFLIPWNFLANMILYLILIYATPVIIAVLSSRNYISIGRVSEEKNASKIRKYNSLRYAVAGAAILSIATNLFSSAIWDYIRPLIVGGTP